MQKYKLTEKKLGEEFTCTGGWWVPTPPEPLKPEFTHYGTLTFNPAELEGIKLEVICQLEPNVDADIDVLKKFVVSSDDHINIICGVSTNGEYVTLFDCKAAPVDCFETEIQGKLSSGSTASYSPHAVFVSKEKVWFTEVDDIKFKALTIMYTHLNEWVGTNALHHSFLFDHCKRVKRIVEYEHPSPLASAEVGNYDISIQIGNYDASTSPYEQGIGQSASFRVKPKEGEITLDELRRVVSGIQNFLSLTTGERIFPLVIDGTVGVNGERDATMRVLYQQVGTPLREGLLSDILLTYKSLVDVFERGLRKMLDDENMQPVYDQYFAEFHHPSTFIDDRFMAAIRVIEAFHRRTCERDYYMEKQLYENTLLQTLQKPVKEADIEDDFRKSLESKLKYGYRYSLRTRLKELFEKYGDEFLRLFVNKSRTDFINEIVVTRNWFTHFDEDDRSGATTDADKLTHLSDKLGKVFMTILLLNYIGVPMSKINSAIQEDKKDNFMKFGYLRPK